MELNRTDVYLASEEAGSTSRDEPNQPREQQVEIIPVHRVYELLDGTPVPKYDDAGGGYYMPEYDKVFQGF